MATQPNPPVDIGDWRKIRLSRNKQGYYEVWWTDAARGYSTRRESCRTKIVAEAETYLRSFCDAARQATAAVAQPVVPTVEDLCVGWLNWAASLGKAETGRRVLAPVRRLLGRYTADQLTGQVLQDYPRQRGVSGVSDGTIRREMAQLKAVINWGIKQGQITTASMPVFNMPPGSAPRLKYLDPTQEAWFWDQAMLWGTRDHGHHIANAAAYRTMLFVALGLETAARREAIWDLTWDRVDLKLGRIDFNKPGKRLTKKRRVTGLRISDRLLPVLQEAWLKAPKDPSGQAMGRLMGDTKTTHTAFRSFTKAIGMEWVTPHVLRHTYASLSVMAGVSLWKVAQVMGDTAATVDKTYAHLMPGHMDDAVNQKALLRPRPAAVA
jgi:integrase